MSDLGQKCLRDLIDYNHDTGVFTWRAARPGCRSGDECGRVNTSGYLEIGFLGKLHHAHRLAFLYMTGEMPLQSVDHINRNKLDNRWVNLRLASQSQNMANVVVRPNNTSGFPGVTWDKDRQKWRAQIRVAGKKTNLGRFADFDDAKAAVSAAARDQWGEFASWAES